MQVIQNFELLHVNIEVVFDSWYDKLSIANNSYLFIRNTLFS